jgi:hypothetical protein
MSDLRRIIWLASFPKSGNTWMRSLLAHYFMPKGMAPDINNLRQFTTADVRSDFFDAAVGGKFLAKSPEEWIKVRPKALRLIAASKPNHHFVKTHCQPVKFMDVDLIPPELTAAAIYIIRNPFDVAPSFARHQNVDLGEAIAMMGNRNCITGTQQGIYDVLGRWDEHVTSWTVAPGLPIHVVRYEDLLVRPGPIMRRLLEKFLMIKVDKPKLAYAIQSTSFDVMKRQEEKLGFLERPKGMKSFFAKGKAGAWREDLTPEQVGRILGEFRPVIEQWYPEMVQETEAFAKVE